jgi:hypothetical protein
MIIDTDNINYSLFYIILECTNLTYGYLCDTSCGHCKSRDLCDRVNGSCLSGCENGWEGDKCDIGSITL